jgi:hypothetical protein
MTPDGDVLINRGNVGIGTTNPASILELQEGADGALGATLTLDNPTGNAGAGVAVDFRGYPSTQPIQARIVTVDTNSYASKLVVQTKVDGTAGALTDRITILSDGKVGIGTSEPAASRLHIFSGVHPGTENLIISHDTEASGRSAGMTFGTGAYRKAGIELYSDGAGNGTGALRFLVDSNTDAANVVSADVKMIISSSGNVGIGTTDPSATLDVRGTYSHFGSTDGYMWFKDNELNSGYNVNANFTLYLN